MAAKKENEGLYGYPVTEFKGPNGEKATVTSAVTEHNLRAAGYVPASGTGPSQEDVTKAAAKADDETTTPAQ